MQCTNYALQTTAAELLRPRRLLDTTQEKKQKRGGGEDHKRGRTFALTFVTTAARPFPTIGRRLSINQTT